MKGIIKRKTLGLGIALLVAMLIMMVFSLNISMAFAQTNGTSQYDQNFLSSANTYNATITKKRCS